MTDFCQRRHYPKKLQKTELSKIKIMKRVIISSADEVRTFDKTSAPSSLNSASGSIGLTVESLAGRAAQSSASDGGSDNNNNITRTPSTFNNSFNQQQWGMPQQLGIPVGLGAGFPGQGTQPEVDAGKFQKMSLPEAEKYFVKEANKAKSSGSTNNKIQMWGPGERRPFLAALCSKPLEKLTRCVPLSLQAELAVCLGRSACSM